MRLRIEMHNCPVCGYNKLRRPPADHLICPSCGTQFGYSDAGDRALTDIHASLRRGWIDSGAKWHSKSVQAPDSWNPWNQLRKAKLFFDVPWYEKSIFSETFVSAQPAKKAVFSTEEIVWSSSIFQFNSVQYQ
jgi:hypothetical protein